ncbi:MAG: methyltransferase domain-containing protein [Thaumarchaeota archaeon]|nr:MAG: methyltransferase domain-containing protein [Nitrososphaerota archaeon]
MKADDGHELLTYADDANRLNRGGLQTTAQHLFHGLAPSYDSVLDYATLYQDRYWKRFLIEEADLEKGLRVLDLACGTGVLEDYIEGRGCEVVGLDLTERMIRIGKERRLRAGSLVVADAERIPFGDETFDVVLSCYLPKYCRTGGLASEVQRVLKPGGRVLLYDFTRPRGFLAPFHAFYVYGVLKILGAVAGHISRELEFTFKELPEIIRRSTWDQTMPEVLQGRGFGQVGKKVLSGGVVTAFWGTKSPASP